MQHTLRSLIDVKTLVIPLILALLLLVFSQVSFLLFHTLAEFFAIIVAILLSVESFFNVFRLRVFLDCSVGYGACTYL